MKQRIFLLILTSLLLSGISFGQGVCGSYKGYLQDDIDKYPDFYKSLEQQNAELEKSNKTFLQNIVRKKTIEGKKIIPVVVHVIHNMGSANISDSDIQNALDALNENINGQSDKFLQMYTSQQVVYPKTPDIFAALRGVGNVEFRLARLDPFGNATNGIVRVQSEYTNGTEPNNLVKTLSYWNSYQYLNIWVVSKINSNNSGTTLGYAQFPWGGMSTDGIVILYDEMDDIQSTTLTHEVGHWLGLCHTWDCGGGSCGDDGVFDTPLQRESNGFGHDPYDDTPTPALFPYHVGLPSGTSYGCQADSLNWAGEMFMNYMDYTNDNYCTMFSKGQVAIFDETLVGDTAQYGFRIHIWSDDNIIATGTADGYLAPTCTKKVFFDENLSHYSLCLGSPNVLKGNKPIFSSITKWEWDFGDGTTDSTGNNSPQHIYSSEGAYDVSLTVEYDQTTEARAYNLSDLDITNASFYDSITSTLIVQGTQTELSAMGASNIQLHMDEDGYSLNSYWLRNQETTDSLLNAYLIDTFYHDSIMNVSIIVDSTFLSSTDSMLLSTADSSWIEDVLLGTIDTFILSYAHFADTTTFTYFTYQDSIFLSQADLMSINSADTSWYELDIQIDSNYVYYGEFNDTTVLIYITYIDSTFLSPTDSLTLYIASDSSWSIDGILSTNDSIRVYYAQFNNDSILELLSININDSLSSTDSLILSNADSSWYQLELTVSDSIVTYYAQYYNDSTIEFSTYVNSSLSISDSLTLYNADSTWTEESIVGHIDTTLIYSLTFIDTTTISYLTYIDSTYLSASDSITIFIDADNFYTIDGMLNTSDSIRIYYAQFNNDSIIEISAHIDTGLTFSDSLLLLSSDVSSFIYEIFGQVDTMRTYYGHYNYNRYDGYFADTLFYRGEIEEMIYVAYYTNTCSDTIKKIDFITILPTTATNNASSYTYSFEDASELGTDWVIHATENQENIWDFITFEDNSWERVSNVASDGSASVMMPAKDGNTLSTSSLVSSAYNLSGFTNPAIKFSWSGAGVHTYPVNELNVFYSNDCGWSWKPLGSLTPQEVADAGLYNSSFKPKSSDWNDTIMFDRVGSNALKDDNIRFRFEYVTNGSSNNFYLDNIQIGEESALFQNTNENNARLAVYPNPTSGLTNILMENLADKDVQVKLMNILGADVKLLFDGSVISKHQTFDTDLSQFEDGIYFISVYSEGKAIITDKIILFK